MKFRVKFIFFTIRIFRVKNTKKSQKNHKKSCKKIKKLQKSFYTEFRGKKYIFTIKINARKKHIIFFRLQMMTKLFIVDYINIYIIFRVKNINFT
jgi:hypothetical protein